jgi:hypothetical protein
MFSLTNGCDRFDERNIERMRSVRRILEFIEMQMRKAPLNPTDIRALSAEVERLRLEMDALS